MCEDRSRRGSYNSASADDKAVRGGTEVVKRETGDERESRDDRRAEDLDVAGRNDLGGFDQILKVAIGSFERDGVAELDIAERAKKSVAMTGESDVTGIARQGGLGDVANSTAQNGVGIALNDDGLQMKARDLDFADDAAFDERSWRELRLGAGDFQFCLEFGLFVGLVGVRVNDHVDGITQRDEANREKKI